MRAPPAGRSGTSWTASAPPVGTEVECELDWERRYALMRTHTALHILCAVVWRDWGAKVTGANMEPLAGAWTSSSSNLSGEFVRELEQRVNVEVAAARPTRVDFLPREEADRDPELIRNKVSLLPPSIRVVRVVGIEGLDLQADGGTHVADTSEVGAIALPSYKSKGRINKRHRAHARQSVGGWRWGTAPAGREAPGLPGVGGAGAGALARATRLRTLARSARGRAVFSFYEGPPTANGDPGSHHVLLRSFKDTLPPLQDDARLPGRRARPAGTATACPSSSRSRSELGSNSKREIEAYGVAEFNERCRESVLRYIEEWERLTERIGFWIDLDDAVLDAGDAEYIESVWWALRQLWDKGLLYKGTRSCRTARAAARRSPRTRSRMDTRTIDDLDLRQCACR